MPSTAARIGFPIISCLAAAASAVLLTAAGTAIASPAPPAAANSAGWGQAREIPGSVGADRVSCASRGNCVVGGSEQTRTRHLEPLLTDEVKGTWQRPRLVPGIAALDAGKTAFLTAVSCSAAGSCLAGGWYYNAAGRQLAFVTSEVRGTWRPAGGIPGLAAFNGGQSTALYAISCGSAGNCAVGGSYRSGSTTQAFVASETAGTWGSPMELPGTGTLNAGGSATLSGLSCASPGNCAAMGSYSGASDNGGAFVASESEGTWAAAIEVPGTAAVAKPGTVSTTAVSCGAPGDCSAGGTYADNAGAGRAFVVSEKDGTWSAAQAVRGIRTRSGFTSFAAVMSLSCAAAGSCVAGGMYRNGPSPGEHFQAFVVTESHGSWGGAKEVPGTGVLNKRADAEVWAVSCAPAGNCAVGGIYTDAKFNTQAFVASGTGGSWSKAVEVPGTSRLNKGGLAAIAAISCPAAGACTAVGGYSAKDGTLDGRGFLVSQR